MKKMMKKGLKYLVYVVAAICSLPLFLLGFLLGHITRVFLIGYSSGVLFITTMLEEDLRGKVRSKIQEMLTPKNPTNQPSGIILHDDESDE